MSAIDTSRSIDLIYSAVTRPELWGDVVESLACDMGSNSGIICVEKPDHSTVLAYSEYGFDSAAMQPYADYYVAKDVWLDEMYARPVNEFYLSHEMTLQRDFLNSEIYNDWGKYQNMYHATGICVDSPKDVALRFSLQRGQREGEYSAEEKRALNEVAPHMRRAITLHNELVELELVNQKASRILDQLPFAAFLLDEKCHIRYRNAHAEALLAETCIFNDQGNGLHIEALPTGRLECLVFDSVRAGQGSNCQQSNVLRVQRDASGPAWEVSVSPLMVDDFQLCFQYQAVLALVIVRDFVRAARVPEALLKSLGLSNAEANVAQLLCRGLSATQIAHELNRSLHTVRTHIRSILNKTESRSQPELLSKLLAGISPGLPDQRSPFSPI